MSEQVDAIIVKLARAVVSSSAGVTPGLGGTLKFDFGAAGSVLIDGASGRVSTGADKGADCTIAVSLEDFERMAKGELDGTSAFMQGKLRVAGDIGLALKIGPILQKVRG